MAANPKGCLMECSKTDNFFSEETLLILEVGEAEEVFDNTVAGIIK